MYTDFNNSFTVYRTRNLWCIKRILWLQNKSFILLRFLGLWTVYDRRDEVYAKRLPADQRSWQLQNSQLFKHSHRIQRDAVERLRQSEGRLFFQGKWRHDVSNSVWTSSCIAKQYLLDMSTMHQIQCYASLPDAFVVGNLLVVLTEWKSFLLNCWRLDHIISANSQTSSNCLSKNP